MAGFKGDAEEIRRGRPVTADEANRAYAGLDDLERLRALPPLALGPPTPGGREFRRESPDAFWALLSGGGPGYSWTATESGRSGSGNAYDLNLRTGLAGKVVYLEPGYGGDATHAKDWRFESPGLGGTGCAHQACITLDMLCASGSPHVGGPYVGVPFVLKQGVAPYGDGSTVLADTTDADGKFCFTYTPGTDYFCTWTITSPGGASCVLTQKVLDHTQTGCNVARTFEACVARIVVTSNVATWALGHQPPGGLDAVMSFGAGFASGSVGCSATSTLIDDGSLNTTHTLDVCMIGPAGACATSGAAGAIGVTITPSYSLTGAGCYSRDFVARCVTVPWCCADETITVHCEPIPGSYVDVLAGGPVGSCGICGASPDGPSNCDDDCTVDGLENKSLIAKTLFVTFSGVGTTAGPYTLTYQGQDADGYPWWWSGCLSAGGNQGTVQCIDNVTGLQTNPPAYASFEIVYKPCGFYGGPGSGPQPGFLQLFWHIGGACDDPNPCPAGTHHFAFGDVVPPQFNSSDPTGDLCHPTAAEYFMFDVFGHVSATGEVTE